MKLGFNVITNSNLQIKVGIKGIYSGQERLYSFIWLVGKIRFGFITISDSDSNDSGDSDPANSESIIKLDSRNNRLLVDIFVKAHFSFIKDISLVIVHWFNNIIFTEEFNLVIVI